MGEAWGGGCSVGWRLALNVQTISPLTWSLSLVKVGHLMTELCCWEWGVHFPGNSSARVYRLSLPAAANHQAPSSIPNHHSPKMATKSETASPDSRSSTPSPVNEKKRPREDTDTQHQEHPTTSTSPPGTPPAVRTDRAVSVDDLLIPLAEPDWTGFASKLQTKLDDVRAEESRLTEEYHKWCWVCLFPCTYKYSGV